MCSLPALFLLMACGRLATCCIDENNNTVPWLVIYKLPEDKEHPNELVRSGEAYVYISGGEGGIDEWTLSPWAIGDPRSIPGLTLDPLYGGAPLAHLLYNDEPAVEIRELGAESGHSKGAVLGGSDGGVWLVHSVPRWPPPPRDRYSYPKTATTYGQSMLCLSIGAADLEEVARQLLLVRPHVYSGNVAARAAGLYPQLLKVLAGRWNSQPPYHRLAPLRTALGTSSMVSWTSFSKGPGWGKELWADWVAGELGTDLLAETWRHGPGALPSSCQGPPPRRQVLNVLRVSMPNQQRETFSSERDHSKWAVGTHDSRPYICIGDINRAEHQKKRGGGAVCTRDLPKLWKNYLSLVNKTEPCHQ